MSLYLYPFVYVTQRLNQLLIKAQDQAKRLKDMLDLLDRGLLTRNKIPLSDELVVATFKGYFEVVRQRNDQPTIDRGNNGLALCPNHHRAMDRLLIAPVPMLLTAPVSPFFGLALRAGGPRSQPEKGGVILFCIVYPGLPSAHGIMCGAPWAIIFRPSRALGFAR
ncbi:hypothetical protein SBV1_1200001 [Verrucomicrobia bacterium]|nr:hypothetical protein SBV1_1200001 [Verrucomicrobiota bacterium]